LEDAREPGVYWREVHELGNFLGLRAVRQRFQLRKIRSRPTLPISLRQGPLASYSRASSRGAFPQNTSWRWGNLVLMTYSLRTNSRDESKLIRANVFVRLLLGSGSCHPHPWTHPHRVLCRRLRKPSLSCGNWYSKEKTAMTRFMWFWYMASLSLDAFRSRKSHSESLGTTMAGIGPYFTDPLLQVG